MTARLQNTTPRKLIKALQRLGFVVVKIRGSHYIMQKGNLETCIPYHSYELRRRLLMEILRQAGITQDEISPYL